MFWSRIDSPLAFISWILLVLMNWVAGWLLTTHVFRLRKNERLVAGLAVGLLLFILFSNLLARLLPLSLSFWAAGLLSLIMGLVSAWRNPQRRLLQAEDLHAWPQVSAFAALVVLFALINRGLAIFDDYHNLPIVSLIASGDVPPHFYLNPDQRLAYHYGLHLFAASLVRIGGFFPWGAFDLSKAITLALTLSLAWLWFMRVTRSRLGSLFGTLLILFGGGARWLLLFLPIPWIVSWGSGLELLGSASATGPDLFTVLASPWNIEGAGPFPFPFAFVNGIFPTLSFALGGGGALPQMTLILLLLLARKDWPLFKGIVFGLLLASLALSAEHLFVLVWAGIAVSVAIGWLMRRPLPAARGWLPPLAVSAALALSGGGVITEIARGWTSGPGNGLSPDVAGFAGFSLRWPPAFLSAHLGSLALTDPGQLLIALVEAGPVLLILPWLALWTWKQIRRGRWMLPGVAVASGLGLLLPLFIRYGVERDITRLTGSALFIWMVLGFPLLWFAALKGTRLVQFLLGAGYGVAVLGGVVLFALELIAITRPQFTYFVQEPDAQLSQALWDRLEPGALVLDPAIPYRSVTLFGRSGGYAYRDLYSPLPEWSSLLANPDPVSLANSGYTYVYLDKTLWQSLTAEQKQSFQQPCVRLLAEQVTDERDFRRMLDIHACR